ncbi:hypothetical protein IFR09_16975 [Pseudomonas syringae]|nr:hypothetical protein [Pseudomonas syringae]MBD8802317.1 hypothetical protein [Pseudomonas syringae]MBD8812858.1 hypothetical protein [Pseudomonas syringae]
MRLLRKISIAKWQSSISISNAKGGGHFSADAITGCLRTLDNTLSVWKSEGLEEEKCSIMALSASLERLEKIDYIYFDLDELARDDLKLVSSEVPTAVLSGGLLHRDIAELDHSSLERVAIHVQRKVSVGEYGTLTRGDIKEMLRAGIRDKLIDPALLKEKLRSELGVVD